MSASAASSKTVSAGIAVVGKAGEEMAVCTVLVIGLNNSISVD